MFVISQLQFGEYLGEPCYAPVASLLPRPIDLKKEQKHRGDFDILILHRHHGILVAEIKAVGEKQDADDNTVAKRVQRAVKQLDKAGEVLTHIVSDFDPPPSVKKTLDVFLLTADPVLRDKHTDTSTGVEIPASGVVRGLRQAGVPLCAADFVRL
nr:hypothetical protein BaRGS_015254 [Batillaria attramentaria]